MLDTISLSSAVDLHVRTRPKYIHRGGMRGGDRSGGLALIRVVSWSYFITAKGNLWCSRCEVHVGVQSDVEVASDRPG